MAIRILSNENVTGNLTLHSPTNAPYIDFVENADTSDSKARITMDQIDTNNGTLLFATENAGTLYNQVKITQTGNLLLSNDAASFNTSNAKLNVLPASSGVYQQWNYSPSNENFSLKLKETVTSGNVRYVFEQINNSTTYPNILVFNSGKVGIGTDEPDGNLEVIAGTTVSGASDSVNNVLIGLQAANRPTIILDTADTTYTNRTWNITNVGSAGSLFFGRNGLDVLVMKNDGNVGIGTTSPSGKLNVEASGNHLHLRAGTAAAGKYWNFDITSNNQLYIITDSNNGINITNAGLVGIGTVTNTARLNVGGKLKITDDLIMAQTNGRIDYDNGVSSGALRFFSTSGNTERMRITSAGSVGIGTTSPSAKLEIVTAVGADAIRLNFAQSADIFLGFNAANPRILLQDNSNVVTHNFQSNGDNYILGSDLGIGTATPSQKLDVQGNVNINGTVVEEGSGNNKTFRYRTTNSSSHSGGNSLVTFGRFYWTPAHWVSDGPVLEVTLQCKYYLGEQRKYTITAGYQDNEVVVNELQPSSSDQKITLQVGAKTAAGYNYASQPVYYVDLQWTQTAYIWGWAQLSQQVPFLTANPTSGWGGVVVYSALSQNNNAGTPQNHGSFFAGDIGAGGQNKARFKSDGVNTYVDAIPANSEIRFRVAGAVEKFRIASSGATTQTMDSTTSLSHLWSQGIPVQNVWYTVYTYSQYDSVCFFAMVSFENDAGDGANQAAMFATSSGAAYGAAFGVQQISGGTGIEARRSSTSFQVRQTIGAYTNSTRLNVRFVSIN